MMIFGGQVDACSVADRHPSHGLYLTALPRMVMGSGGTTAGSQTAHKVRMAVDVHEIIFVDALSYKGQLQVDFV